MAKAKQTNKDKLMTTTKYMYTGKVTLRSEDGTVGCQSYTLDNSYSEDRSDVRTEIYLREDPYTMWEYILNCTDEMDVRYVDSRGEEHYYQLSEVIYGNVKGIRVLSLEVVSVTVDTTVHETTTPV